MLLVVTGRHFVFTRRTRYVCVRRSLPVVESNVFDLFCFEPVAGMALGLMYEVQNVIDLFVAIISHEFIMSFSIGMELVKYNKTKAVRV